MCDTCISNSMPHGMIILRCHGQEDVVIYNIGPGWREDAVRLLSEAGEKRQESTAKPTAKSQHRPSPMSHDEHRNPR